MRILALLKTIGILESSHFSQITGSFEGIYTSLREKSASSIGEQ